MGFPLRDKTIAMLVMLAFLAAGWVFYRETCLFYSEAISSIPKGEFQWEAFVKTVLIWWLGIGLLLTVALKAIGEKISNDKSMYWIILACIGGYILLSHPFLKIPYDMWQHLLMILSIHDEGRVFFFYPDDIYNINPWHNAWAMIFRQAGIDNLFIWARVIHTVQFLFVFGVMLYATRMIIHYLIPNLNKRHEKWLSLFSVLLWFVGNGTHSEAYQQSWIFWYSITYQAVAVPLFWVMGALSVRMLSRPEMTGKGIITDIALILGAAWVIARVHAMELLYFFLYFGILLLFHHSRAWDIIKKYYRVVLPSFIVFSAIIIFGVERRSALIDAITTSGWDLSSLMDKVLETGRRYMEMRVSRFSATFSEIALFSLIAGFLTSGWLFWDKSIRATVNSRLFLSQIFAMLCFFLIPLTTISAGLAGLVTHPFLVYRFFWGTPWFILLPVMFYLVAQRFRMQSDDNWMWVVATAIIILFINLSPLSTGALYANARSFVTALDRKAMGPQYGEDVIQRLEIMVDQRRPSAPDPTRSDVYYIRGDLAYLVRGCLRKYVYTSRFGTPPRSTFFKYGLDKRYRLIDLDADLGSDFPKDQQLFRSFPFLQTHP